MKSVDSTGTPAAGTQSVDRAFLILRKVGSSNAMGASLPTLVRDTGLNRTTVYRMLRCLAGVGAVRFDARSRKYYLGSLILELGIAAGQQLEWQRLCAPAVARLASQTGDTVSLMVRSGNDEICVDQRTGSYPIKTLIAEVGTRRPLGLGAGSLAMLSSMREDELQATVGQNARSLISHGRSPEEVLKLVRRAQKAGCVAVPVHRLKAVRAVAVPITGRDGEPLASLSVTAIAERMPRSRQTKLLGLLRAEARSIEDVLSSVDGRA